MVFSAFAEAIDPGISVGLTSRASASALPVAWLAEVWNSTERRLTYLVRWNNFELAKRLPHLAQKYRFEDSAIHPVVESLELDPACQQDCELIAGLLATCQAWIAAIQAECVQAAQEGHRKTVAIDLADDYLLLTSHWIAHPWVRQRVQNHRLAQARAACDAVPERSHDAYWPNAIVIHAKSEPLLPEEEAYFVEREESIAYWLERFDFENRAWSSEFEVNIWDAREDSQLAHRKIVELERLIHQQRTLIDHAQSVIRKNHVREVQLKTNARRGRPKLSRERQEVAAKFMAQWVQSLSSILGTTSCNQLESVISGSSQRNWRRWLKGDFIPTVTSLSALGNARVNGGPHRGKVLRELPTAPGYDDLLPLVRLCGMALTDS